MLFAGNRVLFVRLTRLSSLGFVAGVHLEALRTVWAPTFFSLPCSFGFSAGHASNQASIICGQLGKRTARSSTLLSTILHPSRLLLNYDLEAVGDEWPHESAFGCSSTVFLAERTGGRIKKSTGHHREANEKPKKTAVEEGVIECRHSLASLERWSLLFSPHVADRKWHLYSRC